MEASYRDCEAHETLAPVSISPGSLSVAVHRRGLRHSSSIVLINEAPHCIRTVFHVVNNREQDGPTTRRLPRPQNGAGASCDRGDTNGDRCRTRHQLEEDAECSDEGEDQVQHDSDVVGEWRPANRGLDRPQEWKGEFTSLHFLTIPSSSHHDLFLHKSCSHLVLHLLTQRPGASVITTANLPCWHGVAAGMTSGTSHIYIGSFGSFGVMFMLPNPSGYGSNALAKRQGQVFP